MKTAQIEIGPSNIIRNEEQPSKRQRNGTESGEDLVFNKVKKRARFGCKHKGIFA